MTGASFDKSRILPMFARVDEEGEVVVLTFVNSAAAAYDISGKNFKLAVYRRPSSSSAVFTLEEGDGLTVGGSNNELSIDVSAARAAQSPNTYFYRLWSETEDSTWLNGPFYFHQGEFDGVNDPEDFTVTIGGTEVTIEITASSTATAQSIGDLINSATAKTTPVDADLVPISDSAASWILKKVTWANVKATLKTYFDTLYAALSNTASALTDASTIDITGTKHTLATSASTRTFTISYSGDDITLEVTLSATSATYTFPAGSLCISEGVASGDNTLALAGVSGDKYLIGIKKVGSAYYVVAKNFGQ